MQNIPTYVHAYVAKNILRLVRTSVSSFSHFDGQYCLHKNWTTISNILHRALLTLYQVITRNRMDFLCPIRSGRLTDKRGMSVCLFVCLPWGQRCACVLKVCTINIIWLTPCTKPSLHYPNKDYLRTYCMYVHI